jgi:heme-degrading monooxygenase HmoA
VIHEPDGSSRRRRRLDHAESSVDHRSMIVEIALLQAKPGAAEQLREGLCAARAVIARAPGYRGSVFYQGIEEPDSFILRVEWDAVEAHMQGFRQGPLLAEWRGHFAHLLVGHPKVTHYDPIAGP